MTFAVMIMVPSANCFSDGSIPITIELTDLNLQPVPNRENGLSVEFPKVHFIIPGIGLKAGSGARAFARWPSRCLPHPPVTSARVAQVRHNRVGARVEDTESG